MSVIAVAGGAGYLGSHMLVELLNNGYEVLCIDDFSTSNEKTLENVSAITGKTFPIYKQNICDTRAIDKIFSENNISTVIHFAGYKAVGESVAQPLKYYQNNLGTALSILEACIKHNVSNFIFSSSATVYGEPQFLPLTETHPLSAINPYGRTKLQIEEILADTHKAYPQLQVSILRYFNPVGAHESGLLGDNPLGIPNNLMPFICQAAAGIRKELTIFGNNYDTTDGTGVRDYIHVLDLVNGHLAALKKLETKPNFIIHNLGTGQGTSVLELINAFEKINNVSVPHKFAARRAGDAASCFANPEKALYELNWKAEKTVDDMVRDSWKWQLSQS